MDNEKELVRFILQYLLDNHFESKSDMARQLDIRHRTMQRVFEQLHNLTTQEDELVWHLS